MPSSIDRSVIFQQFQTACDLFFQQIPADDDGHVMIDLVAQILIQTPICSAVPFLFDRLMEITARTLQIDSDHACRLFLRYTDTHHQQAELHARLLKVTQYSVGTLSVILDHWRDVFSRQTTLPEPISSNPVNVRQRELVSVRDTVPEPSTSSRVAQHSSACAAVIA